MKKLSELTEKLVINSKSRLPEENSFETMIYEIMEMCDIDKRNYKNISERANETIKKYYPDYNPMKDMTYTLITKENHDDLYIDDFDYKVINARATKIADEETKIYKGNFFIYDKNKNQRAWYYHFWGVNATNKLIMCNNGKDVKIYDIHIK